MVRTEKKFSSKMDHDLLDQLRQLSRESNTDISALIEEAVRDLINKKSIRPDIKHYAKKALKEFSSAFKKLAE